MRDLVAAASFAVQMHQVFLEGRNPPSPQDVHRMFEEAYAVADLFEEARTFSDDPTVEPTED